MSKNKDVKLETEFKENLKELAAEYESNLSKQKNGSPTQQQSINNTPEPKLLRGINSLTDAEFREMYEQYDY